MRSFIAALNRHDVDAQYAHCGPGIHFGEEGQRALPNRAKERPDGAARFIQNGRLVFNGQTAAMINPLVREWRAASPCRLYHPSFDHIYTANPHGSDVSRPPTSEQGAPGAFYRVRPDGGDAGAISGGPRREYNQTYSPDGSRIAFDAHSAGVWESEDGGWEIWVMTADGTGRQPLTRNEVNDWGPSGLRTAERFCFCPAGTTSTTSTR